MHRVIVCSVAIVVGLPLSGWSWHDGGHKIIAAIAYRQLNQSERNAVFLLLQKHPRYAEEFTAKIPHGVDAASQAEWAMHQAAIFPDIAKTYHGDLNIKFNRPLWHFVNFPRFLTPQDRMELHPEATLNLILDAPPEIENDCNVIQVIRYARKTIGDPHVEAPTRAVMLCWLLHTVGDIHQPLHSTALFSKGLFPTGDRGGNRISTKQKGNLHSLWDDFPGGNLSYKTVQQQALKLTAIPELKTLGDQAANQLDEAQWLDESMSLAAHLVYDDELMAILRILEEQHQDIEHQPIDLSEDYLRAADTACDKRLIQAGFRLAALLSILVR